jgi:hypothetical protein
VLVVVGGLPVVVEVVEEPGDGGIVVGVVSKVVVVETGVLVDVVELEEVVVELLEVVVVDEVESGDTQPAGGVVGPTCPGIRTVPAQPKLLKSALTATDPPSEKSYVVLDCTMNPCASTATSVLVEDRP